MKYKNNEYQYTIFLHRAEEGGYIADVPLLPGCMSQGETIEEAIQMTRDAIDLYLKVYIDRGKAIPVETENVILQVKGRLPHVRKTSVSYS